MYKVGSKYVQNISSWYSVENIADLQVQRGSNKKNAGKKFHERLRKMVKQPEYQFDEQGYYIAFDPIRDGNCQFSSVCRILRRFGFQRSPEALRTEIVSYLDANPNDPNGTPLDF